MYQIPDFIIRQEPESLMLVWLHYIVRKKIHKCKHGIL